MKSLFLMLFAFVLTLIIAACGEKDNGGNGGTQPVNTGTVNGTLSYPAPAEGKEWGVVIDRDHDGNSGNEVRAVIGFCGAGTEVDYSISGVPPGTYYVLSVVRIVSPRYADPQPGDYAGFYGGTLASPPQAPNATVPSGGTITCNITLEPY